MRVIALTGRAGSGKDTAAYMLQVLSGAFPLHIKSLDVTSFFADEFVSYMENTGNSKFDRLNRLNGFNVLKFAYPVYQIAAILAGYESAEAVIADPSFKNQVQAWGLTGRELLQKIGTECFREVISKNIWIDIMDRQLKKWHNNHYILGSIISDLRFLNEAKYLQQKQRAVIIKLVGRDSGTSVTHESESQIELLPYDFCIHNTGSYTDLMNALETVCRNLNIFNCKYTWK